MAVGLLLVVFAAFAVVSIGVFVWWLLVLIEAVRIPDQQWVAAGQNKLLHVLLMVFLGVVGTLVYVLTARPALRAVAPI